MHDTMSIDFGIFDHLDRGGFALGELYANRLRLIEAYDRAGFHAYHLAEHHGTSLGMAPVPGVFLSAVAQRTRRLRFGPSVYVLPVHDPLRLIEEVAILDHLSHGRFEIGVGRGVSHFEFNALGVDRNESRERFGECLDELRDVWGVELCATVLDSTAEHLQGFTDNRVLDISDLLNML